MNLDTLYWVGLGVYAALIILWQVLAVTTLFWPNLLGGSDQVHSEADFSHHFQDLVLSFSTLGLGLFLVWMAPRNRAARWFAVGLVGTSVGFSLTAHHLLEMVDPQSMQSFSFSPIAVLHIVFHVIAGGAYVIALLLFPNGRLPRLSAETILVWVLLSATFIALVVNGHEPAYFILFCGIAVVLAGWFSQWHKAHSPELSEAERAMSRSFERSFRTALIVAAVLIALEWKFPWHAIVGVDKLASGPMPQAAGIVLTAVPPLLAGTSVVVFLGILQYDIFGVSIERRKWLAAILIATVMGLFVMAEIVIHSVVSKMEEHPGITIAVSLLFAITATVLLERSIESLKSGCYRLVFGTSVNPAEFKAELTHDLTTSALPEAVVPALASVLHRSIEVTAGRLVVLLPSGGQRIVPWPPGAVLNEDPLPLIAEDTLVGDIQIVVATGSSPSPAQRRFVQDLGTMAAVEMRRRVASQDRNAPAVEGTSWPERGAERGSSLPRPRGPSE